MAHTTVLAPNSLKFGSAMLELGLYTDGVAGLANIGAGNGFKFRFEPSEEIIEFDNTEEYATYYNAKSATITGDLAEVNAANVAKIMAGIVTSTPVAAAEVTVAGEAFTLTGTTAHRLANKMGDNSEVSTIVVTDATGNAATRNTDYVISVDAQGYTCIARIDASAVISTGEGVKVDYKYTPTASTQLDAGGSGARTYLIARLTNIRPSDSKKFQITGWKVKSVGGLEWAFGKDSEATKPITTQVTIELIKDTTRANGEQLFRILDEQSP